MRSRSHREFRGASLVEGKQGLSDSALATTLTDKKEAPSKDNDDDDDDDVFEDDGDNPRPNAIRDEPVVSSPREEEEEEGRREMDGTAQELLPSNNPTTEFEKPPPTPQQRQEFLRVAAPRERASLFRSTEDLPTASSPVAGKPPPPRHEVLQAAGMEERAGLVASPSASHIDDHDNAHDSASLLLGAKPIAQEPAARSDYRFANQGNLPRKLQVDYGGDTRMEEENKARRPNEESGRGVRICVAVTVAVLLLLFVLILVFFLILPHVNNNTSPASTDKGPFDNTTETNSPSPTVPPSANPVDSIRVDDDDEIAAPTAPPQDATAPPTNEPTEASCTICADPKESVPRPDVVLYYNATTQQNFTCANLAQQVQAYPLTAPFCEVAQDAAARNCGCPNRPASTPCFFCALPRPNQDLALFLENASPSPTPSPTTLYPTAISDSFPLDLSFSFFFLDLPTMAPTTVPSLSPTTPACPLCFDGSVLTNAASLERPVGSKTCRDIQDISEIPPEHCWEYQMMGAARCDCESRPPWKCWLCPSGGVPPNLDLILGVNDQGEKVTCWDALLAAAAQTTSDPCDAPWIDWAARLCGC